MAATIMTFYSYKGGTGRSMGLANIAWILAAAGHRVLAVDWDLEAPGLHRYFHPFLPDADLRSSPGVINLVWEFATAAVDPDGTDEPGWHERLADISPYAMSVRHAFPGAGTIDLVPAGRQDSLYSSLVMSFDWANFYQRLGGGGFLEALKRNMRDRYDYVLIDSRTGLSDTAGICTVQLPDILVDCFVLSTQAVDGAAAVAASVAAQRPADDLRIFPVPMRVEDGEQDKLESGRDFARERFGAYLRHLSDPEGYWGDVEVPYRGFYAYEEILATVGDRPRHENTLLAAFERLTGYLTGGRVTRLAPTVTEAERRDLLLSFQRGQRRPVTTAPARTAEPSASGALPDPAGSQAVLIGVDTYAHLPGLPAIRARVSELAALLSDPEVLGVPPANVRVLINPPESPVITQELRAAAAACTTDGLLFVFYAGHSLPDPYEGLPILALPGTDPARPDERGLPYRWIQRELASTVATRRILVLDCAYRSPRDLFRPDDSTALLVSGTDADGPSIQAGAFTDALVGVLSTGIPGSGPELTLNQVTASVQRRLTGSPGLTFTSGIPAGAGQLPLLRNPAHGGRTRSGDVLIAAEFVADPELRRAVILILRYEPGRGALGVRIDRPIAPLPSEIRSKWPKLRFKPPDVFDGGPVARDGFIALALASKDKPAGPGFRPLRGRLGTVPLVSGQSAVSALRVVRGYLGWGPGGLEAEIESGLLVPADLSEDAVVTGNPRTLWHSLATSR